MLPDSESLKYDSARTLKIEKKTFKNASKTHRCMIQVPQKLPCPILKDGKTIKIGHK